MVDRRKFLTVIGAVAAGGAVAPLLAASTKAGEAPATRPGKGGTLKLGCQAFGAESEEVLQYYARMGVRYISAMPRDKKDRYDVKRIKEMRKRAQAHGITVYMGRFDLRSSRREARKVNVLLDRHPDRDKVIAEVADRIRACGEAGLPGVLWNLAALWPSSMRTEPTPGRGGTSLSTWNLSKADPKPFVDRPRTAKEIWENITYLLERIVPVAEKAGVKLACHPMDPPVPPGFRGVPRVVGSVEGMKKFVSVVDSPYHGFNFCQGTASEFLDDPGREVYDVIRFFGRRKKIFNVHFRNLRGNGKKFVEVSPEAGDIDMLKAMRVYKEVGYDGMIMPDHMPRHPDDPKHYQGFAFAYGYIRGLMQAVGVREW